MKVCDISAHEFLSVRSCGLSGFSLALTIFFLSFGAVFCAEEKVLFDWFPMLVYDSSEFVYIVAELCTENYLLVLCFYVLE